METLTFHSLRGGQTTGAKEDKLGLREKVLVYDSVEVVDRRRVPPLRRLCPCFLTLALCSRRPQLYKASVYAAKARLNIRKVEIRRGSGL